MYSIFLKKQNEEIEPIFFITAAYQGESNTIFSNNNQIH